MTDEQREHCYYALQELGRIIDKAYNNQTVSDFDIHQASDALHTLMSEGYNSGK
jgi:hypothetical protein